MFWSRTSPDGGHEAVTLHDLVQNISRWRSRTRHTPRPGPEHLQMAVTNPSHSTIWSRTSPDGGHEPVTLHDLVQNISRWWSRARHTPRPGLEHLQMAVTN